MQVHYDIKADLLYIRLAGETQELVNKRVSDDVVLDMGPNDRIVGIEILDASKHLDLAKLLPKKLNDLQRNRVRTLAVSLSELGDILPGQGAPEYVQPYEEAYASSLRIKDNLGAAISAYNLGHVYKNIPALHDLDQAERWYSRSLELFDEYDTLHRGRSLISLGIVAYERYNYAMKTGQPDEQWLSYLNMALQRNMQAIALLPLDAVQDLAIAHNLVGGIYNVAGDFDRALRHWRESSRYEAATGNTYGVAQTQFNIASTFAVRGRFEEALLYAQAALRNYQDFGPGAAADVQKIQALVADIEAGIERLQRGG